MYTLHNVVYLTYDVHNQDYSTFIHAFLLFYYSSTQRALMNVKHISVASGYW